MTTERIKEIQSKTAYPESVSVQQALLQVWNECEQEQLRLHSVVDTLPQDPIVLARYLHEAYEMIAKKQNWNTQENCKVDFSDLPVGNKNTMILLAGKLILDFGGN